MIDAILAMKKTTQLEAEKGVLLAPSAKDLRPWCSERDKGKEHREDKKSEVCSSYCSSLTFTSL
jgi:hypothetical protein